MNNIVDIYELAPMQHGILFHAVYEPSAGSYFEQMSCEIRSGLDVRAFRRAWQTLVDRHAVLRTAFHWEELDKAVQVVYRQVSLPWQDLDWSQLSHAAQAQRLQDYLAADRALGFALDVAPLMRCALIRLGPATFSFVWSHHHLILDGWCLPILFKEVLELYASYRTGRPPTLASPRPYRDYILWLQQQDMVAAERFWRDTLQGFDAATPLHVDRMASAAPVEATGYADVQGQLASATVRALETLARQHRVTFSTVVQSAWALLLSRYSQEEDVVFGATVSGRPPALAGVASMVGLFINTLPVRVRLRESMPVSLLLEQIQAQQVAAAEFAFAPLAWIQKWSEVPAGTPLFASLLVFENYPFDASLHTHTNGLQIGTVQSSEQTNYPLTLVAVPGAELTLKLLYDCDRFDAGVMAAMLTHLQTLLTSMSTSGAQPLAQLDLLDEAARHRLLVTANETRTVVAPDACLHQLIEAQVQRTPEALAVYMPGAVSPSWGSEAPQALTYDRLNARANQLAHYLRTLGVGPEVPVGLCFERSIDMIVGLLAILKSGGAYLPLDPSYPRDRLAFMLADAGVDVVLTQQHLVATLPDTTACLVCSDTALETLARLPVTNPQGHVGPANSAYIIYTSGSTGIPKGAINTHRAICNRLLWMQRTYHLDATDRVLHKTPLSFDVSVWELFWPLLAGAVLVLAKPEGQRDPAYLTTLIAAEGITTLHFVPSMFGAFLDAPDLEDTGCLRRVICSGEALSTALAARFLALQERLGGAAVLYNLYGPTEAAVDVTSQPCNAIGPGTTVPIGRPIDNVRMHILDRRGQPVPVGVPGELYIGGVALAAGYRHRPGLTAEKFVPDAWGQSRDQHGQPLGQPGERLYRTGDLARYLTGEAQGAIEFLGRLDDQVKIMGMRIEPGEVEAALMRLPGITQAVVVPREVHGRVVLVAYLVLAPTDAVFMETHTLYRLPNGLEVSHLNKNETDMLYREIVEEQTYLRGGITLRDGDCIFDVGANLGLFSLFLQQHCRNVSLFAFEPVPPLFAALERNAALHGLPARLFACGLADRAGETMITYYPHATLMSGLYANTDADADVTRAFLSNQDERLRRYADEFLADRFQTETYPCQLRTLSEVIREYSVARIDLLKVDVEKSEMDVLQGIAEDDWPKITQLVVEVHDITGRLAQVRAMLAHRGYRITVVQDPWLRQTEIYNLYAVHPARDEVVERNATAPCVPHRVVYTPTSLRQRLMHTLPDHMIPTLFLALDTLPLLPNGKLNRRALPLPDTPPPQPAQPPHTATEHTLVAIWAEVLGQAQIDRQANFFALGGDSIISLQVVAKAAQAGLRLTPKDLFRHPILADLAALVSPTEVTPATPEPVTGTLPLLPIQHWFFEENLHAAHHFNQSVLLAIPPQLGPEALRQILSHVLAQHDALRLRFTRLEGGWQQEVVAPDGPWPLHVFDLSHLAAHAWPDALVEAATGLQTGFDYTTGPLAAAGLFLLGGAQPNRLLLVIHHLLVDGVSWRILLDDIVTTWRQLESGQSLALPARTTSFRTWAQRLAEYAGSEAVATERAFWLDTARREVPSLPLDAPAGPHANTTAASASITVALDSSQTRALLHEVHRAYHTQINDVLLTALAVALCAWMGAPSVLVMLEDHGREELFDDVDLSRTVGWCTSQFPVLLHLAHPGQMGAALQAIKEQLRAVPRRGIGYGLLRYLGSDRDTATRLQTLPQAQVRFNYLGQLDRLFIADTPFTLAAEAHGPGQDPQAQRAFLLDINALVRQGTLQVEWSYSRHAHRRTTIAHLAEAFLQALQRLIAHCLAPEAGGFTPSDFPEAGLSQDELNALISDLR